MAAIARLAAVSLDSSDPVGLATFYRQLLDLEVFFESEDFVALKGAGILITTQRVEDHRAPSWPGGPAPKPLHLELAVSDLEEAEAQDTGHRGHEVRHPAESGSLASATGPRWAPFLHQHSDTRGLTLDKIFN